MSEEEPPLVTRTAILATAGFALCAGLVVAVSAHDAGEASRAVDSRLLTVLERPDGGLDLRDQDGALVAGLDVAGDLLAITAMRGVSGRIGQTDPAERYRVGIELQANGRLAMVDPVSDRRISLDGFGADNRAAFAALLQD